MEKTGLIDKVIDNMSRSWRSYQLVNESKEVKEHDAVLAETLSLLKDVKGSKNLNVALGAEEMLLRQEQAVYANSPEQHNSIITAVKQLQEAKQSLAVVANPKAYQAATATYPSSRKEAGLPIDSFRDFLKSHSTRLTNRMTAQLSVPEKNILRQRKDNLGMIREVYIAMQREALGLMSSKNRTIER